MMRYQLPRSGNATGSSKVGVNNEPFGKGSKLFIKRERRSRFVGLNIVIDLTTVSERFRRPEQAHERAAIFRRVCLRRAENSASTASAGTSFPALAESSPACTAAFRQSLA